MYIRYNIVNIILQVVRTSWKKCSGNNIVLAAGMPLSYQHQPIMTQNASKSLQKGKIDFSKSYKIDDKMGGHSFQSKNTPFTVEKFPFVDFMQSLCFEKLLRCRSIFCKSAKRNWICPTFFVRKINSRRTITNQPFLVALWRFSKKRTIGNNSNHTMMSRPSLDREIRFGSKCL